jgi:hypothetical protein
MSTTQDDSHDRLPTTGADPIEYDRYKAIYAADDELLIYDLEDEQRWIQSSQTVHLDEWR